MGFFSESLLISDAPPSLTPKCGVCKLYKGCNSPKMPVTGKGKRKILIVGEAPGKNEDKKNKQFCGESGQLLDYTLDRLGVDMRRDCWLTNSLICRPPDNATPTDDQIQWCHPNLTKTIEQLKPEIIITVGLAAIKSVTQGIWKEKVGAMSRWVGWRIPDRTLNAWICPTYHPSYVMREVSTAKNGTPIEAIFRQHLKRALKLKGRPYDKVPDYTSMVEPLTEPRDIIKRLRRFRKRGGAFASDVETNMLKPDHPESRLVTAAVCWKGRETIAFPWAGSRVKREYAKLMKSKSPRIGHGIKFDDRWCTAEANENRTLQTTAPLDRLEFSFLKPIGDPTPVWDTMNVTHAEDNRRQICSLSFQAYVRLGVATWHEHISKFFEAKYSYQKNHIEEIDLHDLLIYNGVDVLSTYDLAMLQLKDLGMTL